MEHQKIETDEGIYTPIKSHLRIKDRSNYPKHLKGIKNRIEILKQIKEEIEFQIDTKIMCIGTTALFLAITFVYWLCIIPTALFGYLSYLTIKKSSQDRERALN